MENEHDSIGHSTAENYLDLSKKKSQLESL